MDYEIAWTEPAVADLEALCATLLVEVKTRQNPSGLPSLVISRPWLGFPSSARFTAPRDPAEYTKSFVNLTGSSIASMKRFIASRF